MKHKLGAPDTRPPPTGFSVTHPLGPEIIPIMPPAPPPYTTPPPPPPSLCMARSPLHPSCMVLPPPSSTDTPCGPASPTGGSTQTPCSMRRPRHAWASDRVSPLGLCLPTFQAIQAVGDGPWVGPHRDVSQMQGEYNGTLSSVSCVTRCM